MTAAGVHDASGAVDRGLDWYLDLRKFGGAPSGGWGMGFERLVLYVTGTSKAWPWAWRSGNGITCCSSCASGGRRHCGLPCCVSLDAWCVCMFTHTARKYI